MLRRFLPALLAVPTAVALLTGCGGSDPGASVPSAPVSSSAAASSPTASALPDDAVVTYEFHDSSVPPTYHRSITLTVTKAEAHLVIDSYGDVLADEKAPVPEGVWATLGATLPTVSSLTATELEQGCAGGTGIELQVMAGQSALVDLSPEFCAGSNSDLEAPITAWIAPARDLFPATDVLAPTE